MLRKFLLALIYKRFERGGVGDLEACLRVINPLRAQAAEEVAHFLRIMVRNVEAWEIGIGAE